ncbi:hypothetical protein HWV62_13289 [Athelia sp. TMB]|nr:hypothetical protein HWV62_13289 [Athelia sp. TMB]
MAILIVDSPFISFVSNSDALLYEHLRGEEERVSIWADAAPIRPLRRSHAVTIGAKFSKSRRGGKSKSKAKGGLKEKAEDYAIQQGEQFVREKAREYVQAQAPPADPPPPKKGKVKSGWRSKSKAKRRAITPSPSASPEPHTRALEPEPEPGASWHDGGGDGGWHAGGHEDDGWHPPEHEHAHARQEKHIDIGEDDGYPGDEVAQRAMDDSPPESHYHQTPPQSHYRKSEPQSRHRQSHPPRQVQDRRQRDLPAAQPHRSTDRVRAKPSEKGLANHIDNIRQFFTVSKCTGTKRALCIGINYTGQENELHGCVNDAKNMARFIMKTYGFRAENVCLLTDDSPHARQVPTKKNMEDAMDWLVKGAKCHDSLFFHYSGHGGLTKDLDGDEIDGYDEVIFPVDYKKKGEIVDDVRSLCVPFLAHGHLTFSNAGTSLAPGEASTKRMSTNCKGPSTLPLHDLTYMQAVFDSCHSGTALDLDYIYHSNGRLWRSHQVSPKARKEKQTPADVISFCACKDSGTSADTEEGGQAVGAMSYGLLKALKKDPHQTYSELLKNVRQELKNKYKQRSQLSSSHPVPVHKMPSVSIRHATSAADTKFIISSFDSALPWLASIGSGAQWGAEPFSERPKFCQEIKELVEGSTGIVDGMAWIADVPSTNDEGAVSAGAIVLSKNPPSYAPSQSAVVPVPEIYIRILITDQALGEIAKGVGSKLIDFARNKAKQEGAELLRVDCWKGGADSLLRYYEKQGFVRVGDFQCPDKHVPGQMWTGWVLEEWLARRATSAADTKFIIDCFDNALPWLASIGKGAQWGSEPFSEKEYFCKEVKGFVEESPKLATGIAWIADVPTPGGEGTVPAGAIVLSSDAPSYAPSQSVAVPVPEIYIRILITDQTLGKVAKGVGSKLIEFARNRAKEGGMELIRVDCWRGGDDSLMK